MKNRLFDNQNAAGDGRARKLLTALSWHGLRFAALLTPLAAWSQDAAVIERGRTLFSSDAVPACAICHTLSDAGAEGAIGPNLDELKPDQDVILKVLEEGMGAMPPFAETLDAADKQALAEYIVAVTRP